MKKKKYIKKLEKQLQKNAVSISNLQDQFNESQKQSDELIIMVSDYKEIIKMKDRQITELAK
ncbi:MAG: hypothetical protein GQ570_11820 [Helicobacteraceae bacterium]|nr:hypothetical protein [Helicobacteraceae bacterium]